MLWELEVLLGRLWLGVCLNFVSHGRVSAVEMFPGHVLWWCVMRVKLMEISKKEVVESRDTSESACQDARPK